ncbi:MAG TPA: c-type cytochrome [Solirubrobacterales bacterium]|jgi:cytochrome c oxidase subunit 2|nr:c-type cytochrome [Solirubrobacterales bacterium]
MREGWAFIAIAAIAFVAGLLIGDLGASPKTETVAVSAPAANEAEGEAVEEGGGTSEEPEPAQGADASSPGAQLFASAGCGGCHTLAAAGTTGTTGPNLDEFLAPDDTTAGVEEMLVDPNVELAEGYPANVMPQSYGQTFSKAELHQLAEYLVATTPAKPDPSGSG